MIGGANVLHEWEERVNYFLVNGIGSTNPQYTLDVNGSARVSGGLIVGNGSFFNVFATTLLIAHGGTYSYNCTGRQFLVSMSSSTVNSQTDASGWYSAITAIVNSGGTVTILQNWSSQYGTYSISCSTSGTISTIVVNVGNVVPSGWSWYLDFSCIVLS